ncbi:hypothetical protein CYMTET_54998 [Cymbomonas tetramitiformis]|uniref:Uncharacterized protein n=1 Tax=Cymbomonas tetramitiformis TaxID=36881 RepID=A0AAE0BF54_9CHLO|nr:hypothetical protein CYMTET_54998 [Cymbomonas tetramitiformis]
MIDFGITVAAEAQGLRALAAFRSSLLGDARSFPWLLLLTFLLFHEGCTSPTPPSSSPPPPLQTPPSSPSPQLSPTPSSPSPCLPSLPSFSPPRPISPPPSPSALPPLSTPQTLVHTAIPASAEVDVLHFTIHFDALQIEAFASSHFLTSFSSSYTAQIADAAGVPIRHVCILSVCTGRALVESSCNFAFTASTSRNATQDFIALLQEDPGSIFTDPDFVQYGNVSAHNIFLLNTTAPAPPGATPSSRLPPLLAPGGASSNMSVPTLRSGNGSDVSNFSSGDGAWPTGARAAEDGSDDDGGRIIVGGIVFTSVMLVFTIGILYRQYRMILYLGGRSSMNRDKAAERFQSRRGVTGVFPQSPPPSRISVPTEPEMGAWSALMGSQQQSPPSSSPPRSSVTTEAEIAAWSALLGAQQRIRLQPLENGNLDYLMMNPKQNSQEAPPASLVENIRNSHALPKHSPCSAINDPGNDLKKSPPVVITSENALKIPSEDFK